MAENVPSRTAGRSTGGRLFGVVTDERTYRSLAYLLLRFPLGVAYFVTFVTGIAVGVALVPLAVGVPVLGAVLGLADHVGLVEAALLRRLFDREVRWAPADPGELPVLVYLETVATDPRVYALLVFSLASFFVGVAAFVVVVTLLALSVALALAPLLYWLPGVQFGGPELAGGAWLVGGSVDSLPEALVASVVGLALGLASLHLFDAAGRLLARVVEAVLTRQKREGH